MTGVIGYANTLVVGGTWTPDQLSTFEEEMDRFHQELEQLSVTLALHPKSSSQLAKTLLQGPLSDAMTHVGQLAYLRRLVGSPVPPENFVLADIDTGRFGANQPLPRAPKEGWKPDQPPPAPGRPLQE